MPWYRTGTVSVTNNSTTVTGTGTDFSANSRVGDAFQGPDGRWYEVTNIASTTVISILPAYQGTTASGGVYGLAPMQGYVKQSADQLRAITNQYGTTLGLLGTPSDATQLRTNIGAAKSGANSDITSITGLTTPLSVSQGGTGGVPVTISNGGTGSTTAAAARTALGLGSAAVAPILGTVSQSGGVPTGAIIERGSNANGEYVKFADGTAICWVTSSTTSFAAAGGLYASNSVTVTLPITFATTTHMTVAPNDGLNSTVWVSGYAATTSTITLVSYYHSSISGSRAQRACVLGRWF